jgi:uncharacterized protein YjbJ (UPF0337 family)
MNKQNIFGLGHQLKGAVKAGLGRVIGDAKLVADGNAEQASGTAQTAAGDAIASAFGVDKDRLEGVGHQLKGAAKLGLGKLIGDGKLVAEGTAERASGKAQDAIGSARDQARDKLKTKGEADIDETHLP